MRFYTGTMFPEQYRNLAFIARRGSWNRSRLSGYDVVVAHLDAQGNVTRVEEFLTGLRNDEAQTLRRPAGGRACAARRLACSSPVSRWVRSTASPIAGEAAGVSWRRRCSAPPSPFSAAAQDAARGAGAGGGSVAPPAMARTGAAPMEGTPSLAGQPPLFITLQMILFREGLRQVPAMTAVAAGMADGDDRGPGRVFRLACRPARRRIAARATRRCSPPARR